MQEVAKIYATGFVEVFLPKASAEEKQRMVLNLASALSDANGWGVKSGYMELAARLERELRAQPSLSATDLISLIRSILSLPVGPA